ncbi:MAG: hypothetical protein J4F37_10425 [Acidobacteria bacterium]|nr:hypothetical protein [Acidobacteriota bacterium]
MAIRTELSVRLQNSPGALDRVCQCLTDQRVNILALTVESAGVLRMVVDNPLHAAGLLEEREYGVEQRDVLFVQLPNDPGALERAARMLANADVNVEYAYGSVLEDQVMTAIVVGVEDAQRASMAAGI